MVDAKTNESILKLIFEQPDAYKFVIGIFVLFILPQIINIVNTIIKNKTVRVSTHETKVRVESIQQDIKLIKDRIDIMYSDNFDECTPTQIEYMFRGRVSIDIDLLIKNTKQVIFINHISDKDTTRNKVYSGCSTVFANTRIVLNHFKRNGKPCGSFINSELWTDNICEIITTFIYNADYIDGKSKPNYNYEALRYHLKTQYDAFTIEFINKVNKEIFV